jgi:hypothetical protein
MISSPFHLSFVGKATDNINTMLLYQIGTHKSRKSRKKIRYKKITKNPLHKDAFVLYYRPSEEKVVTTDKHTGG